MLLKLIPASQEPTIHFSLSFAELPSSLPTPSSWTAQLSHLMHEDLEVPATLHSLDRAAGIPSLLEEVSLDVEAKEIRCRYVDGSVERIAFGQRGSRNEQRLMNALASIIRDVRDSTLEDERVMKAREWERQRQRSSSVSVMSSLPLKLGRPGKHKKQRSLFMHIVSCVGSIINITSPSTAPHPSLPFYSRSSSRSSTSNLPRTATLDDSSSFTPPNTPVLPTPGSSPRARALRRAARSALVDTFRQFILSELVRRFYAGSNTRSSTQQEDGGSSSYAYGYDLENHHRRERGGFCVWILHSMRRRALERMEGILEEAGPAPPPEMGRFSEEVIPGFCPTTMDVPLSFSDEEDEEPRVESPVSMEGKEGTGFPVDAELEMERDGEEGSARSSSSMDMDRNQAENRPRRPSLTPRRASSSSSISTDDSSESGSTSRSTSSMSTVSTAPSSIESDSDAKEDTPPTPPAKDVPLSLYQPQYSSQHPLDPNIRHLSPAAKNEYTQLYDLRTRLGQLVQFAASQSRVAAEEVRNRREVLAVRSRRRAWLNKALTGSLMQTGAMFGLATPFRSSLLARYMYTADDLVRRASAISRSACSSTSSLSSSYFRTVSSVSSSTSFSASAGSSVSKSSISPFPSRRPKLRPKIDYGAALAAAIVDFAEPGDAYGNEVEMEEVNGLTTTTATSWDATNAEEEEEDEQNAHEFELSQEVKSPSRARRHRRRTNQDVMLPTPPVLASKIAGGRLFPVSEEMEHEDDEFTMAFSARGRGRGRGKGGFKSASERGERTFMGCDEVREDNYADNIDSEYEDDGADDANPDLEMGSGFDVDIDDVQDDLEMGLNVGAAITGLDRPQIRPRVRTTSMMGALLRGAKRSLGGGIKPQLPPQKSQTALTVDSLLYQPLASAAPPSQPQPQPLPKTTPSAHAQSAALMHASNRRAMDLARPPASAIHTKVEIDAMDVDVEMNVQLRIDEYEYSAGAPLAKSPSPHSELIDFDVELQTQQHAHEEFTLAMDVPRRGAGAGGARRRRDMHYSPRHEAPRRPKLNGIFQGQLAPDGSVC